MTRADLIEALVAKFRMLDAKHKPRFVVRSSTIWRRWQVARHRTIYGSGTPDPEASDITVASQGAITLPKSSE